MTSVRLRLVLFLSTLGVLTVAVSPASARQAPAGAQTAAAAASSANTQDTQEEDDAILQPAEPEYRLINLPTTMLLPSHRSSFDLTHRFGANLSQGSFAEHAKGLFGIDQGAVVGFEFRYAIARRLQAAVYRTTINRTIQFHGKYDAVRQSGPSPVSVSALLSVEGTDNFSDDHSPSLGAVVSRLIGDSAAFYATPIWVHNVAPGLGVTRDTFFVGVGGRVRVRPTVYVTAEVAPRVSGYRPGPPEFGFAIEKRAGGHMFQINFTNTFSTTYGQVARGGAADTIYLGFNLARKFF
jgi:hypothetical protein